MTKATEAKKQAMADMIASGLSIAVFRFEKVLIELTRTNDSVRIDFRDI